MTKEIERLKDIIHKMETAHKTNRMILADKLDIATLTKLLAEFESNKSKINRLEKMAGITESDADIIQIPNKNTPFVYCNVKAFGFDLGQQYEVLKVNKKQGTFTVADNNEKKETFSLLSVLNNSFSVSKIKKK
ncbi:hypothetical protein LISE100100_00265 [Listeria seeligeri]|uniref:hypothetical protein n=1 Tax=Listeria seeligeri TaxID=1640 RepID=UPI0001C4EC83|nr:hypothetical protein [Listeria seeligeri]CBH27771.1 hypothetical protein lse_1620 [Listeria seeligeri serovar 1/2b str. SLCC3954]